MRTDPAALRVAAHQLRRTSDHLTGTLAALAPLTAARTLLVAAEADRLTRAVHELGGGLYADAALLHAAAETYADADRRVGEVARVLAEARSLEGVPYVWGGADPATGVDCSGFVQWVYGRAGITLPRTTYQQVGVGSATTDPQPGDLVFFGDPPHHVGIYVGGGQMIDAAHTGTAVRQEAVWGGEPVSYRRVVT